MALAHIVARNCRRFRDNLGISMGELARRSGLSKQTIVSVEHGHSNPTLETLEALAAALEVSTRAMIAEIGQEVLVNSAESVRWRTESGMQVRQLDKSFGSGYVFNAIVRLEASRGPSRLRGASGGTLRHCYIIEGDVRLGPEHAPASASTGDFVRFPADTAHVFEAVSPVAVVFVCTTAPQLSSMGDGAVLF